jgi:hypothetical protein
MRRSIVFGKKHALGGNVRQNDHDRYMNILLVPKCIHINVHHDEWRFGMYGYTLSYYVSTIESVMFHYTLRMVLFTSATV